MSALMTVRDLSVQFAGREAPAVDTVSFDVDEGTTLGLVGESGSGKTTVARAILNLLPSSATVSGHIGFDGEDLVGIAAPRLRGLRWTQLSFVPQTAMNSLDPVRTVESQFMEVLRIHDKVSRQAARARVREALASVGIDPDRGRSYPHQLSGGTRQRVLIALATILRPRFLIADEPTTGLDVIVQDQVMATLERIRDEQRLTMILVTHDLGVVSETCDRVVVMCEGKAVEQGGVDDVILKPSHLYTDRLVRAAKHRPPARSGDRRPPGTPMPGRVS